MVSCSCPKISFKTRISTSPLLYINVAAVWRSLWVEYPLPSLRLKAIRNGNEDYELIAHLKSAYKQLGLNYKGIFNLITAPLYYNAKINDKFSNFDKAQRALYSVIDLAVNYGVGFSVKKGKQVEITLKGNVDELKIDGKTVDLVYCTNRKEEFVKTQVVVEGK